MQAKERLANIVRLTIAHLQRQDEPHPVKSIAGEYRSEWNDLIAEQQRSRKDKTEIEALIILLIILFARRAYLDGMKRGGIDDPEGQLTADDTATITTWAAGQSVFAGGMAQAIIDSRTPAVGEGETVTQAKDEARQSLIDRSALWAASLEVMKFQGMARADQLRGQVTMATWRYGDTQHCTSTGSTVGCDNLNGMRMPLSWFAERGYVPGQPGSTTLTCGGWRCACGLFDDSGRRLM